MSPSETKWVQVSSSETPPPSAQSSYPTLVGLIGISEVGGVSQLGNRFVSFVRARAAVCKVRMDLQRDSGPFPFSLLAARFLPFSLVRSCVPFPLQ